MRDDIDFPVSPAWAAFYAGQGLGQVSQEFRDWLGRETIHQRYIDRKEELPKPIPPRTFTGIGERDMLTKKQIQQLEAKQTERMQRKPQPHSTKNPFGL